MGLTAVLINMKAKTLSFCALVFLVAVSASGCGPITPASVAMKAGTWVAQKVVTKEIKKLSGKKHGDDRGDDLPRERGRHHKAESRPSR